VVLRKNGQIRVDINRVISIIYDKSSQATWCPRRDSGGKSRYGCELIVRIVALIDTTNAGVEFERWRQVRYESCYR
jgi:hypothetical protein